MSKYLKNTLLFVFSSMLFLACNDWTNPSADEINQTGMPESYYQDLRAWKATYKSREVAFGWFGGWTGVGASMVSSLAGLPDSMDVVSIWGDWRNQTEAKKADLEFVQKVKGLKVMACAFTMNVGDGFTPEGNTVKDYWGWDASESGLNDEPTDNQKAAIRKYARAIATLVDSLNYDGFDMDHEPHFGGGGDLSSSLPRLQVFIEELAKYFGPKSGTGKLLAVDGEPQSIPAEAGQYFDWFIVQAYDCTSYTNLNNRLLSTITNYTGALTPAEVASKYIVTENFEKAVYHTTGGANFQQEDGTVVKSYAGMASWNPLIDEVRYKKGGAGVYHIEYEYSVTNQKGFYPFTRQAIRLMNEKYNNVAK